MKLKIGIMFIFLMISAQFVFAANNVWKNQTYIEGVQAMNNGGYILYLPVGSDNVCKESGKLFYVVPNQNGVTVEASKNILSVALVAYTTGKKVSVLYDNSDNHCYVQQLHLRNDN